MSKPRDDLTIKSRVDQMLGYKGFNHDLTCHGDFQYEVGQTYTMDSQEIKLCSKGFHFCRIPSDVLKYYNYSSCKYAVIKAEGNIIDAEYKSVTNQLTVIKLLTKEELLRLATGLFVRMSGSKEWYENGEFHRLDGPAIEFASGDKHWYQNDRLHRLDGPAKELADGYRCWYQNGQLISFVKPQSLN
jgi:hypothetical protein